MRDNDLPVGAITVFLNSLFVNLAIAVVLFVILGGRDLMSRRINPDDLDRPDRSQQSDQAKQASGRPASVTGATPSSGPEVSPATAER